MVVIECAVRNTDISHGREIDHAQVVVFHIYIQYIYALKVHTQLTIIYLYIYISIYIYLYISIYRYIYMYLHI